MSAQELVERLTGMGVVLSRNGDRLHLSAPPGSVSPKLREEISRHKPTLLAFLRAQSASERIAAGQVPDEFNVAGKCPQCGPVWLAEALPPAAKTCPWCFARVAGKSIPRPPA